jgi:hypothetical protein
VHSGFILPLLQVSTEELASVWRILLVGTDGSLYRYPLDVYYFLLFNYRTLNSGIVMNKFPRLGIV